MKSRRAWIFDLDNTLHNARPHIFPHINRAMTAYLQAHLGPEEEAAGELRQHYWKRYGATLRRLPGRKFVFSNAPVHYSRAVLGALGIADLFDGIFSIEHTRFRPKPDSYGFLRLCRAHRLQPQRCIMVEDTLDNLRTAGRLGMKTVWVARAGKPPGYVDVKIANLMQLPRLLAYLQ